MSVWLIDESSGEKLGEISELELCFLREALVEESPHDPELWIDEQALEGLARRPGATSHLIGLLLQAVPGLGGVALEFRQEGEPVRAVRGRPARA